MRFRLVSRIFTLTFIFYTSSLNRFEMANEINLHYLYFNRKSTQYGTSDSCNDARIIVKHFSSYICFVQRTQSLSLIR